MYIRKRFNEHFSVNLICYNSVYNWANKFNRSKNNLLPLCSKHHQGLCLKERANQQGNIHLAWSALRNVLAISWGFLMAFELNITKRKNQMNYFQKETDRWTTDILRKYGTVGITLTISPTCSLFHGVLSQCWPCNISTCALLIDISFWKRFCMQSSKQKGDCISSLSWSMAEQRET